MTEKLTDRARVYLEILLAKIRVCKSYQPKLGQGEAVSLGEFKTLYGADPLYSWFGLDNPLLYAAHKAAGGMTSLYRQIGTGLETVFKAILRDSLGLSAEQAGWSYEVKSDGKKKSRKLTLDGRIVLEQVPDPKARQRISAWIQGACKQMGVNQAVARSLRGCVFEVRQGYKSKDSKRQNADIGNAGQAYKNGYLPVAVILSTQIDGDVADRYKGAGWLLLRGYEGGTAFDSTYVFLRDVLGFDLAAFLRENSAPLKVAVNEVLVGLLTPADVPPGAGDALEELEESGDDDSDD